MHAQYNEIQHGRTYVQGFGALASFIAQDENHSASIYKRFDDLAARDLLYYQSELAELAALQEQYDLEDARDLEDPTQALSIKAHCQSWTKFAQGGIQQLQQINNGDMVPAGHGQRWTDRYQLAMRIRNTLKAYREAMIQEAIVLALSQPNKQTRTAFANRFQGSNDNKQHPTLTGASEALYPQELTTATTDLVTLAPPQETDHLTNLFKKYLSCLFRSKARPILPQYNGLIPISHPSRYEIRHYSAQKLTVFTSFSRPFYSSLRSTSSTISRMIDQDRRLGLLRCSPYSSH